MINQGIDLQSPEPDIFLKKILSKIFFFEKSFYISFRTCDE